MIMKQEYDKYTPDDFKVWKLLFEPQLKLVKDKACSQFMNGVSTLQFRAEKIASFDETNAILQQLTGWQIHVVPGLIPPADFFKLLYEKKFCSSTWLRRTDQLDYLEEPDMFHDVFGHIPYLADIHISRFLQRLAGIALQYILNEKAIEMIAALYWYTIEFGLIKNQAGEVKIFGAGIVSSAGESTYCLEQTQLHQPFNVATILTTAYRKDIFQTTYFVLDSFEQLEDSLVNAEQILEKEFNTV
jgi:phenylalanine-4-hydroxylase